MVAFYSKEDRRPEMFVRSPSGDGGGLGEARSMLEKGARMRGVAVQ